MAELQQILAIGGPTGIVGFIIAILVKSYFDKRKEDREQQAADVATDSGIVDNAKKVIELVHVETERMQRTINHLADENRELREQLRKQDLRLNEQDDKIARQDRELEFTRQDLDRAREEIRSLKEEGRDGQAHTP